MEHAQRSRFPTIAPWAPSPGMVFGLLAVEFGLLFLGVGFWTPFGAAAISLAIAYFLLAFRSPDVAWAIAFLVLPLSAEALFPIGVISVPTEPMIGLALVAWIWRSLPDGSFRLPASRLHLPLALLGLVSLMSTLLGAYPGVGLKAWVVTAAYVAFGYLYFASGDCSPGRRARWVQVAAFSGALMGLYGTARVISGGVDLRTGYGAARPFFTEHGTYAAYLAMILPVALFGALEGRGWRRVALAGSSVLILLGLIFSFTRAAWLSLAVVLPIALAFWARRGSWKRLVTACVAVAIALSLFLSTNQGGRLLRHAGTVVDTENVSNLERVNRWIAAWEMFKAHPWLGIGYGAYSDAYTSYRRKAVVTEQTLVRMGAHSEPLRLLSETGVVGLLVACWFLGSLCWGALRRLRLGAEPGSGLALGLLAGIATYAVHGIFNSYLGIDKVTMPFWMEVGALAALTARPPREA